MAYDIEQFITTVGSGSWEVPFAVIKVYAECCGGGGGGGRPSQGGDCTPDNAAGGGGGGAWCYKTFTGLNYGNLLSYIVGNGGNGRSGSQGRGDDGGDSEISKPGGIDRMLARGGKGGTGTPGGNGGNYAGAEGGKNGNNGQDAFSSGSDGSGGRGGGAAQFGSGSKIGTCPFTRTVCTINDGEETCVTVNENLNTYGGPGGDGCGVGGFKNANGANSICYEGRGRNGASYGGGGGGGTGGFANGCGFNPEMERAYNGGNGAQGFVYIGANYEPPEILSSSITTQFSNNPEKQPRDELTITATFKYANEITISNGVYNQSTTTGGIDSINVTFNSGLQSNVESGNSPASRTYILTAKGPGGQVSVPLVGRVYNDWCPSNLAVPNPALTNLEPNTDYIFNLGTVSGIDMVVLGTPTNSQISVNFGGFTASSVLVSSGDNIRVKMKSAEFNQTTTGKSITEELGYSNSKIGSVTIGCQTFQFTYTTRGPVIKENNFDFGDLAEQMPNQGPSDPWQYTGNEDQEPYLQSPDTIIIQDIEITRPPGIEVKALDIETQNDRGVVTDVSGNNSTNAEIRKQRASETPSPTNWITPNSPTGTL
jgi:hypothetical protein